MISLCVVTHNEAHRITGCIASALPICDEVIVVDQESTDGTPEVARTAGAIVIPDMHHGYCEISRPLALEESTGDWVLVLDADETVTHEFLEDVPRLTSEYDGVFLGTEHYCQGQRIAGDQLEYRYRFAKRDCIRFGITPHSRPEPTDVAQRGWRTPYCALLHSKTQAELDHDAATYGPIGVPA